MERRKVLLSILLSRQCFSFNICKEFSSLSLYLLEMAPCEVRRELWLVQEGVAADIVQKEESRTMPLVAVTLEPHSYSRKLYLESVFFLLLT